MMGKRRPARKKKLSTLQKTRLTNNIRKKQSQKTPGAKIARKYVPRHVLNKNKAFGGTKGFKKLAIDDDDMRQLYESKCKDQQLPIIRSRESRFFELIHKSCNGLRFSLKEHGLGQESAKALVKILAHDRTYSILELCGNHFRDNGTVILSELFRTNDTIVRVDLRSNDIGSKGAESLFHSLMLNKTLISLDLSGLSGINRNHIGRKGALSLKELLRVNEILCDLNLASNGMGVEGTKLLCEGLENNRTLLTLNVSSNNIGPAGTEYLCSLVDGKSLTHLMMERNQIGDRGVIALAHALKNAYKPSITNIDISYNKISKVSIKELSEILKLDTVLKNIKLDGNEVGNEGCNHIGSMLEVNKRISNISLSKNEIENEGCMSIASALEENSVLRKLDLSSNYIDKGVVQMCKSLMKNSSLRYLDMSNNRIDDNGGNAIAKMLSVNRTVTALKIKQNDMKESGENIAHSMKKNFKVLTLEFAYNNFSYKSYSMITKFLKRNKKRNKLGAKKRLRNKINLMYDKEFELVVKSTSIKRENETTVDSRQRMGEKKIESEQLDSIHAKEEEDLGKELEESQEIRKKLERELEEINQVFAKQTKEHNSKLKRGEDRTNSERDKMSKIDAKIFDIQKQLGEAQAKFQENHVGLLNKLREEEDNSKSDIGMLKEKDSTLQRLNEKLSLLKLIIKEEKDKRKKNRKKKKKKKRKKTGK